MFDLSADLQIFYDKHVRLGADRRSKLAAHRDVNIVRLKNGLDELAAETKRARPHPYDWQNQGGYAMHTLNHDPRDDNDYDIDVALLFERSALPEDPRAARQRVADALCRKCTNFTQEPTARTNAVTVWYYHIDFAVYRTYTDDFGHEKIEHASTEWKARDPQEIKGDGPVHQRALQGQNRREASRDAAERSAARRQAAHHHKARRDTKVHQERRRAGPGHAQQVRRQIPSRQTEPRSRTRSAKLPISSRWRNPARAS